MTALNILAKYSVTKPSGMWEALLGLFSFISNYGFRVILFTVLLKLVLSPLDFFQKYKMKKNQRITEMLKPEMDKLQRQYAGDKQSMQQAQMKIQKAHGFSHFYACIPMLLTLVIFFTFWAGMRNISPYEEYKQYVELYNQYSSHYTQLTGLEMSGEGELDVSAMKDGEFVLMLDDWREGLSAEDKEFLELKRSAALEQGTDWYIEIYNQSQKVDKIVLFFNENPIKPANAEDYKDTGFLRKTGINAGSFDIDAVNAGSGAVAEGAKEEIRTGLNAAVISGNYDIGTFDNFNQIVGMYSTLDDQPVYERLINGMLSVADAECARIAYQSFLDNRPNFLWIKSVWVADVPWKDAVPSYSTFSSNVSSYFKNSNKLVVERDGLSEKEIIAQMVESGMSESDAKDAIRAEKEAVLSTLKSEQTYDKIMVNIKADDDVSGFNGLLLLGVFAVGLSFLSQFITTRQQRKSGQVATSGGMMGGNMKMMYFIMPIISGVMAVLYTATFAVYMVTNSLMTLGINFFSTFVVGLIFKSKYKEEVSDSGVIKYGRRDPNDKINKDK